MTTLRNSRRGTELRMPEQMELRQEIEALATKVVVEDLSSEAGFDQSLLALAGAVRGVRDRAEAGGCREVARIASELCATLDSPDSTARDALSHALETGVAAMQQALESSSVPAAAQEPAAYSLAQDPELDAVREVSHNVETVLDLARNGKLSITSHVIDVVLESADYLKTCVSGIDSRLHGHEAPGAPDYSRLLERVRNLMTSPQPRCGADLQVCASTTDALRAEPEPASAPSPGRPQTPPEEAKAVKVDTGKLDYLVDMAGELVIAQSMVRHDPDLATLKSPRLQRNLAQLARITAELQKTSTSMRLVPIGQLFQRVARQVRDLSRKMGKPTELEIGGEETEIDRTIVEELADPLMHMVRNSLDHGIEDPDGRAAAGKKPLARIGLRACHQAGHIVIQISDDGRGLDAERILAKAMEKGLVGNPEHLSENEAFHLIFEPGFSTALARMRSA